MNLLLTLIFTLSFCLSGELISVSDNISNFSMMNSGSFINHLKRDSDFSKNVYSLGVVSFPGDIIYKTLHVSHPFNNLELSYHIRILNYGELTDASEDFEANEQSVNFSILQNNDNDFTLGASIDYLFSWIGEYRQSAFIYNIGFIKFFYNNKLSMGCSLEDYVHTLENFSNIENDISWDIKISSHFNPSHAPYKLFFDYIYHNKHDDAVIIALDLNIDNHVSILLGKNLYLADGDGSNTLLSNFGVGTRIKVKESIINIGIQYLDNGVISIGSGLTTQFK